MINYDQNNMTIWIFLIDVFWKLNIFFNWKKKEVLNLLEKYKGPRVCSTDNFLSPMFPPYL